MQHPIVSREEWIRARKALLAKEKAFTRERDALSAARRELPWTRVENYAFDGPEGKRTLRDLFGKHRQLAVYHFMFDPSWEAGCKSCSLVSDHFEGALPHLAARDTAFAAISRAPYAKIAAFRARMGWTFPWYSSNESTFNYDFHVSFRPEEQGNVEYNYVRQSFPYNEAPGFSAFVREGDELFHAYSAYGRGLDLFINTYNVLDHTPLGRQEDEGAPMSWVRHHDRY